MFSKKLHFYPAQLEFSIPYNQLVVESQLENFSSWKCIQCVLFFYLFLTFFIFFLSVRSLITRRRKCFIFRVSCCQAFNCSIVLLRFLITSLHPLEISSICVFDLVEKLCWGTYKNYSPGNYILEVLYIKRCVTLKRIERKLLGRHNKDIL